MKLRILFCITGLVLCQAWTVHSQCSQVSEINGTISHSIRVQAYKTHQECWKIPVPDNKFIRMKFNSLSPHQVSCTSAYLTITANATGETYKFCASDVNKNPVMALTEVEIVLNFKSPYSSTVTVSCSLNYEILDLECARKGSFHCTNFTCIAKEQVCDGVKNCENGADERECKSGVFSIPGVNEARNKSILWMKSKRTRSWGWGKDTARAVTALFLADAVNFNGTDLEEELMAKHTELKTAATLMKNSVTNYELSMFINALLVTCHNPRHFYGQDLVKRLKNQILGSAYNNFTHPAAYLALCNANESWPGRAVSDLFSILYSNSEYAFVKDIQAFALMAISCNTILHKNQSSSFMSIYRARIMLFKKGQMSDGSFGNAHTTALVTQALISSGQEHQKDWKLNKTIKYLIEELNSTHVDFLTTYLSLPVLNGRSLSDIAKVDCSNNPRKHGFDDLVDDIQNYIGPKMRVQYSLFIGDEKDVIHTLSLRVPENVTAFEVMQRAELEDQKYNFEWKRISGKMYVYKIGKLSNDPEAGKFWLLYFGSTNNTEEIEHSRTSPDKLMLQEGHHLVMWYKIAKVI